jgi:hypothetical protein
MPYGARPYEFGKPWPDLREQVSTSVHPKTQATSSGFTIIHTAISIRSSQISPVTVPMERTF